MMLVIVVLASAATRRAFLLRVRVVGLMLLMARRIGCLASWARRLAV